MPKRLLEPGTKEGSWEITPGLVGRSVGYSTARPNFGERDHVPLARYDTDGARWSRDFSHWCRNGRSGIRDLSNPQKKSGNRLFRFYPHPKTRPERTLFTTKPHSTFRYVVSHQKPWLSDSSLLTIASFIWLLVDCGCSF